MQTIVRTRGFSSSIFFCHFVYLFLFNTWYFSTFCFSHYSFFLIIFNILFRVMNLSWFYWICCFHGRSVIAFKKSGWKVWLFTWFELDIYNLRTLNFWVFHLLVFSRKIDWASEPASPFLYPYFFYVCVCENWKIWYYFWWIGRILFYSSFPIRLLVKLAF